MWLTLSAVLIASLLGIAATTAPAHAGDKITVYDVRLGVHPAKTRIVLDVDHTAAFTAFKLVNPNRIVLTMPNVDWQVPFESGDRRLGAVSSVQYGNIIGGEGRLALHLNYPVEVGETLILPGNDGSGNRIVIDLTRTSANTFQEQARNDQGTRLFANLDASEETAPADKSPAKTAKIEPEPKPGKREWTASASNELATATLKPGLKVNDGGRQNDKLVIVLDPGHGGRDPGALSSNGTQEADIVLAMAKQLKAKLDKTGRYKALLTRTDNSSVKLRDRIVFARSQNADLFISIHADSLEKHADVRGASVYTLDEKASDKEAAALAKKENRADIILGVDLSNQSDVVNKIFIDIAQRESKAASLRFTRILMPQLGHVTPLMRTNMRSAGFAVLKAPDVPSVLLELGYLSNSQDEKNLTSKTWRSTVANAIVQSIDKYFGYEVAELKG